MERDYSALRGKIVEVCGSSKSFAEAIGISTHSISFKLSGKIGWKQDEIERAIEILHIEDRDIGRYFFKKIVKPN